MKLRQLLRHTLLNRGLTGLGDICRLNQTYLAKQPHGHCLDFGETRRSAQLVCGV